MRLLEIRIFLSFLAAAITGLFLYLQYPLPQDNLWFLVLRNHRLNTFYFFKYSYISFLFTTPFFLYSLATSFLYMFFFDPARSKAPLVLPPPYPDPQQRKKLYLVVGEKHNPTRPTPSSTPSWLVIPERGLFTGIAIFGAIGTGKTSGCMYSFTRQILAYRATDPERRIGGLSLEVKGDFCHKVQGILRELHRQEDYIEISLDSDYCWNPLHNDLDAYALAYGIASLLNNLFGRGKEPFWQQAYTNLVKFIILLHKVLYDHVALFDVYECAINRGLLEGKIAQGRRMEPPQLGGAF